MQLHDEPSKRIARTIPPRLHAEVWRLHGDGLNPRQISEQLAASGCRASRFSVWRLVIQLKRIQSRQEHSKKMAEELKLARASALSLRETYEEELSDVCDDLFIAARKDRHDQVLSLARTGRRLFREVARYGRLYEDALKQMSMLPGPAREAPEAVKMPPAPAQTRTTAFDASRDRLDLGSTSALASRPCIHDKSGHGRGSKTEPIDAGAALLGAREEVSDGESRRLRYGFHSLLAVVASLLFLVLPRFVKMLLAPAQTRTTAFDAREPLTPCSVGSAGVSVTPRWRTRCRA